MKPVHWIIVGFIVGVVTGGFLVAGELDTQRQAFVREYEHQWTKCIQWHTELKDMDKR